MDDDDEQQKEVDGIEFLLDLFERAKQLAPEGGIVYVDSEGQLRKPTSH